MRLITLFLLAVAAVAVAQAIPDPTQAGAYPAYPTYSNYRCGAVQLAVTPRGDAWMVAATTSCSAGGRGSKPIVHLACTLVHFDEAGFITLGPDGSVGTRVLDASWRLGTAGASCP